MKHPLTPEMRRLVIAARVVAFEDQGAEALRELDQASEAFAEDVPWNDEPEDTPMTKPDEMPDWPPQASAAGLPDGVFRRGSTGQQFVVQNGRWERVRKPASVPNGDRDHAT